MSGVPLPPLTPKQIEIVATSRQEAEEWLVEADRLEERGERAAMRAACREAGWRYERIARYYTYREPKLAAVEYANAARALRRGLSHARGGMMAARSKWMEDNARAGTIPNYGGVGVHDVLAIADVLDFVVGAKQRLHRTFAPPERDPE